jgi:hypothetical protein
MSSRFDIVVFNFERIESFLDHFDKIKNFRADRDRLVISDCSINHESQKERVQTFAQQRGWGLGREVQVIKRKNWGIDQGARVDYFASLRTTSEPPQYIWQFQEHYLDLHSPWSIWPNDAPRFAGEIKNDTIPDNFEIDLDECERIYQDPAVSVVYADRGKLGIFRHDDASEWFYAGGANFSARTTDVLKSFPPEMLESYKAIYDGTYEWALFMELDWGRRLTRECRDWFDLVTHHQFSSPAALTKIEDAEQVFLHQAAESFYNDLYSKYEKRFNAVLGENQSWRKLHVLLTAWYVDLLASGATQKFKRILEWMGLAIVAKRMRHYVAGVLRQE